MALHLIPGGSAGGTKSADAKTVTGGLDLAGRTKNRGNLGRAIP